MTNKPVDAMCHCGRAAVPVHCAKCGSTNLRGLVRYNHYDALGRVVSTGRRCCRCGYAFNEADVCGAPLHIEAAPSPRQLERINAVERQHSKKVVAEVMTQQKFGIKLPFGLDADNVEYTPNQLRVWFPDVKLRTQVMSELMKGETTIAKLRGKYHLSSFAVPDTSPDAQARAQALFGGSATRAGDSPKEDES